MLFSSLPFAIFFVALLFVLRAAPRARLPILLMASLLFYASWRPSHLLLLLAAVVGNYVLLRAILARKHARIWMATSVGATVLLLATFKYASLAVETLAPVLGSPTEPPDIALPLGISFYSFEMISLAVDAYRMRAERAPSLLHYALFIAFFPHLIAGPILRGDELLPQLERGGQTSPERNQRGLWLIAVGLVKKVVLADFLLAPYVNGVFGFDTSFGAPERWVAAYSFAFQIYFDFSGYTDMARGLALLLGFELPTNFSEPYLSRNPSEFWRRWHITLSRWLRDYVYIPLGGNRRGRLRTYANLMATMLIGGLWHGAAWKFVLWGGLHGCMLAVHRWFSTERSGAVEPRGGLAHWACVVLLFHLVCIAWVFFRAATFGDAVRFTHGLFAGGLWTTWPLLQSALVAGCALLHGVERQLHVRVADWQVALSARWWGPAVQGIAFGLTLAAVVLSSGQGATFIYFQF